MGVCTGSFAAAAISSSRNMSELIPAGVEAVLAAFRTGLHSLRMQQDIDPISTERAGPWSLVVSLMESQALEILQRFNVEAVSSLIGQFNQATDSDSICHEIPNLT